MIPSHHRPRSLPVPVVAFFALLALLLPGTRANAVADPASDTAQADRHFSNGDFQEAAELYRATLVSQPEDNRNRFLLACLLFELNEFDDAATEFMKIVASSPNAEAASLLAHLCRRRAADPDEPTARAVHAVLVPAAANIPPQQGAWNDDTLSGLTAELLLRQGIFRIDQERLDALLREHPGDLDTAIGTAVLSSKTRRMEILRQAQSRFPDSPVIPMQHVVSLPKTVPNQSAAVPLLDAVIDRAPDNALPRLMKLDLDDQEFAFVDGRPRPWHTQTVAAAEKACSLPCFDNYATERINATRKTLRALHHPFRLRLVFADTPIQVTLSMIVAHLAETVTAASKTEDIPLAHQAERTARSVLAKWKSIATSSNASRGIFGARSKLLALVSQSGSALSPDTLSEEFDANRTAFESFAKIDPWSHIAMIPIPSISNIAVEQLLSPRKP